MSEGDVMSKCDALCAPYFQGAIKPGLFLWHYSVAEHRTKKKVNCSIYLAAEDYFLMFIIVTRFLDVVQNSLREYHMF